MILILYLFLIQIVLKQQVLCVSDFLPSVVLACAHTVAVPSFHIVLPEVFVDKSDRIDILDFVVVIPILLAPFLGLLTDVGKGQIHYRQR